MKYRLLTTLSLALLFYSSVLGQLNENSAIIINRIDSYLNSSVSNGYSGTVLVAKDGEILLSKGYGWADRNKKIPNTPETVFDICSVTKQFTATAVLKLIEDGKLKLADSLGMYFKDVPSDKSGITIHQLLTHSAAFSHGIGKGDFDHIPQDDFFEELFNDELLFQPGEKYTYSNSGYSILGRIIELVSGKSYETYLNEKLFVPSGMNNTGYLLPKWDDKSVANEYLYNVINKGNHIAKYKQDGKIAWSLKANGGINSTQEDMYKWYLALKNNTVLSEPSMEKLTKPHIAEDEYSHYAYGWTIFQSSRNTKVVTHNGFNGVSYYEFTWFPEEDALILFFTNSSSREIARISYELQKMLFNVNYTSKPISKNSVSQLLAFTENYSGNPNHLGEELQSEYPDLLNTPVVLNRLCGVYLREMQIEKALSIAKINIQLFPKDGNIWDTMGDVYRANNQIQKAIDSYGKALELRPEKGDCFWCDNSSEQIKKLK